MRKSFLLIPYILLLFLLTGCSAPSDDTAHRKTGFYFDTVITLTAYDRDFVSKDSSFFTRNSDAAKNCEAFLDECFEKCALYEGLLSATKTGSDVWNINNAGGSSTEVDAATFELLGKALYYAELSDGAFDPTIGTVTDLWNFHADSDMSLPDDNAMEEALSHVDYRNISLINEDGKYLVELRDKDAHIDLGGIAKGYIADRLKDFYLEKGAASGIINLGGNVLLVGGKAADGSGDFRVGIQKPFGDANEPAVTLSLNDRSLVTSGIYDRFFEKDGEIYHHILDPKTGYPIKNDIYSTTIVSSSSVDGDALSTICFSLGMEKGMELIESIPDTYVLYITDKYEVVCSDNFPGMEH